MGIVRKEGVRAERKRIRAQRERFYEKRPMLARFLQEHYPEQWLVVKDCGRFQNDKAVTDPAIRQVLPRTCKRVPYCALCARELARRRANRYIELMARCSPWDEERAEPHWRFVRVFQTAPLIEEAGVPAGRGVEASQNISLFAKITREHLFEIRRRPRRLHELPGLSASRASSSGTRTGT